MRARHLLGQVSYALRRLKSRVCKHPIISISLSLLLVGGVALFIGVKFQKPITEAVNTVINLEPPKERRAIDGVFVEKSQVTPWLVSVMIENAKDAQPISGVDKASLIYESLVEATITRLMAVYPITPESITDDALIGPVRSVRPYYLTWTSELGALLEHVGGSPEALNRIKTRGILTLNEYANGKYFSRVQSRYAPHNIYTTTTDLKNAAIAKLPGTATEKWSQSLPAWLYKEDTKLADRGQTTALTVGYPGAYAVSWRHDKEQNAYTRVQWGGDHLTAEGSPITAKNIAVVFQDMAILDEIGRKRFTTEGSGKALLFRDGTAMVGTWQKDSPSARMRLFDEGGNEMQFNAGTTWIEIVPNNTVITY